jgi:hypothetical protein
MAQLKEDEWPQDGEPTTSEQEGDSGKSEGTPMRSGGTRRFTEGINRVPNEPKPIEPKPIEPKRDGD